MTTEARRIAVHQCLFGYDEGHHLLASSTSLSDESLARLLPLSDLAPGLSLGRDDSYWSGVPLPSAKAFVLMRTWAAWEMRRPGCVWSHALLIDFSDLPEFSDLGILRRYSMRPVPIDFGPFRAPLDIDTTPSDDITIGDPEDALCLLREIYGEGTGVFSSPNDAVELIFAIWSQQWPRLRRSFSFRTASSSLETAASMRTLDLLVMRTLRDRKVLLPSPAELTALEDLRVTPPSPCRRFLWRYGADLRSGRERFWFLIDVYMATRERLSGTALDSLVMRTEAAFPMPSEARLLKDDLLSCGFGQYSLIPSVDFVQLYTTLLAQPHPAFGAPPLEALRLLIRNSLDDAMTVGELASHQVNELAQGFLDAIAAEAVPNTFLPATEARPGLRLCVLRKRPEMITDDVLRRMAPSSVLRLLASLQREGELAKPVIEHIYSTENAELVRACVRERESLAKQHWIDGLNHPQDAPLTDAWASVLAENAENLLSHGVLSEMLTAGAVVRAARSFGYDAHGVMQVGPAPWIPSVERFEGFEETMSTSERDTFCAFLFVVASAKPSRGCELLFERTFETLHNAITYSRLDPQAFTLLLRHLPEVEWWRSWDNCRRLRIAVVNAYVDTGLRRDSFRRLTRERYLYGQLVNIAEGSKRGRQYLEHDD